MTLWLNRRRGGDYDKSAGKRVRINLDVEPCPTIMAYLQEPWRTYYLEFDEDEAVDRGSGIPRGERGGAGEER